MAAGRRTDGSEFESRTGSGVYPAFEAVVTVGYVPGVKGSGRETYHLLTAHVEVRKPWIFMRTSAYGFMAYL
jgi:hypothetical protein